MQNSWKIRFVFAILSLSLAAYLLIPSAVYFSLSPTELSEVRRDRDAFSRYVPSWAPTNHIVPGLDLQGGIHIVLGVDLDKAISDKLGRIGSRVKKLAEEEKIAVTSFSTTKGAGDADHLELQFADSASLTAFKSKILDKFSELVIAHETDNSMSLALDHRFIASVHQDTVGQTMNTLRNRIDKLGVTEPSIARRGDDQVQIQLPGLSDPKRARLILGRTAQLQFQLANDDTTFLQELKDIPEYAKVVASAYGKPNNSSGKDIFLSFPTEKLEAIKTYLTGKVPAGNTIAFGQPSADGKMLRTYTLFEKVELTGDDLVDARVSMGSETDPRPSVGLTMSPTGAMLFDELSARSIGKRLAIVLEDKVDSAPVIQTRISGGNANITMGGARTKQEMLTDANDLALVLKAGALPAAVTFREERSVGPSLGADSVKAGKFAFMVSGLLVGLFMIIYYRFAGLVSVIGLVFNMTFVLAVLSWLGATITLPGIAGLALTIGMAVDANVIINERIREELRAGKMPRSAIRAGYDAALSAVMDANITTFIAGLVLWQYGTGPVQNFATMLLIGTITSVVTAVLITRIFFDMATSNNPSTLSI